MYDVLARCTLHDRAGISFMFDEQMPAEHRPCTTNSGLSNDAIVRNTFSEKRVIKNVSQNGNARCCGDNNYQTSTLTTK